MHPSKVLGNASEEDASPFSFFSKKHPRMFGIASKEDASPF